MASDPLVDRDCTYLDGKCNCEVPEADCKYSGKPFPIAMKLSKEEAKRIMSIGPDKDEFVSARTKNKAPLKVRGEAYNNRTGVCKKGMLRDECPYNPLLGCDCGYWTADRSMGPVKVKKVLKSFSELKDSF